MQISLTFFVVVGNLLCIFLLSHDFCLFLLSDSECYHTEMSRFEICLHVNFLKTTINFSRGEQGREGGHLKWFSGITHKLLNLDKARDPAIPLPPGVRPTSERHSRFFQRGERVTQWALTPQPPQSGLCSVRGQ